MIYRGIRAQVVFWNKLLGPRKENDHIHIVGTVRPHISRSLLVMVMLLSSAAIFAGRCTRRHLCQCLTRRLRDSNGGRRWRRRMLLP